jgi:hypothetical protein
VQNNVVASPDEDGPALLLSSNLVDVLARPTHTLKRAACIAKSFDRSHHDCVFDRPKSLVALSRSPQQ